MISARPPGPEQPMIKGAGTRTFLGWYVDTHGQARAAGLVRRVPDEHRVHFEPEDPHLGILASTWYPAPAIHALLEPMLEGLSRAEMTELARRGAHAMIQSTLTGVYRWLFESMMSPERYAAQAHKLFSRFYNTGTMIKTVLGPTAHLSIISGWTSHHPFLCDLVFYTGDYVYGALGCKDVHLERTGCISRGSEDCRFVVRWRK